MNPGDTVKFSKPRCPEEVALRFDLLEVNGDRVLIRLQCDWTIPPCEVVSIDEVEPAETPNGRLPGIVSRH